MIAGILALFSLLFFGGAEEVFFVDKIEKGVKKYVVEKDRKKEITLELKEAKKLLKEFNKDRKREFKKFKNFYGSRDTETRDLLDFFMDLRTERLVFKNKVLEHRVSIYGKINSEEWNSILAYSESVFDKKYKKEQKKEQKKKNSRDETFNRTRKVISELTDSYKQKVLADALTELELSINELAIKIKSVNVKEHDVLSNKNSSLTELQEAIGEMNELRSLGYKELVLFHSLVKDNTNDLEWESIMKALSKDISLSAR